jgi:imidazolonepropionase-like amidohydrolase
MTAITAVHGDALYDPDGLQTTRPSTVLIEDGRITASGPRDTVQVPAGAAAIDAGGLTLLPGMIDLHVHLCSLGQGVDLAERLQTPASLTVLQAVDSCRKTLDAGFTTVRDAGGTPSGVRTAIERGYFPGPRTILSIQVLSQTGGHADSHFPCGASIKWNPSAELPASVVDGVEPMRQRVRELIRAGADWIKLCTSGGVLSHGDAPHHPAFTLDEIRSAVEEAATQGRKVMAHAQAAAGIKNALRGGVTTIEHGIWIDDEALELLTTLEGRTVVPTLVAPQWVIRHAAEGRMPAYALAKGQQVAEDHEASIRRAVGAGVRIGFGTDTGVGPHGSNGEELLLLQRQGMTPEQALRAATSVAAWVLNLEGTVGTLAAGAFGDVIGVPGDPTTNLELAARAESVQLVVKGGEAVKERVAVAAGA